MLCCCRLPPYLGVLHCSHWFYDGIQVAEFCHWCYQSRVPCIVVCHRHRGGKIYHVFWWYGWVKLYRWRAKQVLKLSPEGPNISSVFFGNGVRTWKQSVLCLAGNILSIWDNPQLFQLRGEDFQAECCGRSYQMLRLDREVEAQLLCLCPESVKCHLLLSEGSFQWCSIVEKPIAKAPGDYYVGAELSDVQQQNSQSALM